MARKDKTLPRIQNTAQNPKKLPRIQKHFPEPKTLSRIQKHFPESKNTFRNPKHFPESKNTYQSPDFGTCFGFCDLFRILVNVFGFWELFWILGRVLDSGKCFVLTSHCRIVISASEELHFDNRLLRVRRLIDRIP